MPSMEPTNAQQKRVVDLSAYRSRKQIEEPESDPHRQEAVEAIEEIARHLLQAIRVIKRIHQ